MATRSGGSKSSGGARKRPASTAKRGAASTAKRSAPKRGGAKRGGTGGGRGREPARRARASRASAGRSDKSVQAFREALDRSRSALEENVTISRDRIQEVADDAVKRGRMTRGDANELVSNLVSKSRKATDDLIRDLEKLLEQARRELEGRRPRPAGDRVEDRVDAQAGEPGRRARRARRPRCRRPSTRRGRQAAAPQRGRGRPTDRRLRPAHRVADQVTARRPEQGRAAQGADAGEARQGAKEHPRRDREAPAELAHPPRSGRRLQR